jgi:hypothetical protein
MIQIIPNLFIGNETDANEFADKVDIVINSTKDIPFYNKNSTTLQIRVPGNDDNFLFNFNLVKEF